MRVQHLERKLLALLDGFLGLTALGGGLGLLLGYTPPYRHAPGLAVCQLHRSGPGADAACRG